ncbi:MAG TPA: hypothetical protein DCZ94_21595 [Lentisphaeria bacterium]|nr:MAG: hypothetical protein A2X48_14525 [Lentisphaerae bacterium GWF2_49_21]HBC89540.1 hypothetical protein [Lentisphaeria bacterium]
MTNEQAIFDLFADMSGKIIKDVWCPTLYRIAYMRRRAWLLDKISRNSRLVGNDLSVKIPFLTGYGSSWRPMGELGYTPTGSPLKSAVQTASLGCHAAAIQVTEKAIRATKGSASIINGIIDEQMKGLTETFPYYVRALAWTPASGILGVQAGAISTLTVTLDNAGLWNTAVTDRAKLFEPGMFVQVLTSGYVKVGDPVEITAVDKVLGTITLASDPGCADNCVFVLSDIAGLENGYNNSGPGILDAIDNDNTFQGVDRSTAANSKFRAVVTGSAGAVLYATLSQFFHDCYDPEFACTNYKVIDRYWALNIQENVRYTPYDVNVKDGYRSILVKNTQLIEDDDCDCDKIIVPNLKNLSIQEAPGGISNLFDKGWQQVHGRPFMEYIVAYWASLVAEDCRYMGRLDGISLTATS